MPTNFTGSLAISGSLLLTGSITTTGGIIISGSIASASYALSSSNASNAELLDNLDSTAFVFTSSYNTDSASVSTRVTRIEGNYATTGSNVFMGAQTVCANITSTGTIIAQTLNVQQVTSSVVYSSGSNIFGCSTSDVQQMTGSLRVTGSGNHYIVGGNVGIGITTPRSLVEIQKVSGNTCIGATSNATLTLSQAGAINEISQIGLGYTLLSSPAVVGYITTNAADYTNGSLIFATRNVTTDTAPTERMRITSAGNVGIGTCTPCSILHIQGAAGSTKLTMLPPSGQPNIIEFLTNAGAVDARIKNESTQLQFETGTSGVPRMIFTSTGIACFACQVCAPAGLYSNCSIGINSFDSNIPLQIKRWAGSSGTIRLVGNDNVTGLPSISFCNDNGGGTAFVSMTANCQININGSIYACPSGNVGIGTTGTTNKLIVLGCQTGTQVTTVPIGKFVNTGNEFSKFIVGSDNNNYDAVMSMDNCATLACTKLRFYIGNGTNSTAGHSNDQIVLQGNGNVGIGTASPNYQLQVNSSTSISRIQLTNTSTGTASGDGFQIQADGVNGILSLPEIGYLRFETSDTERMRITSGGNVCIGSAAVSGEILRVTGCSCLDNYISVYSGTIQLFLDADKTFNQGIVGTQSGHALSLRTSGTNRLTISTAGVLDFPGSNSTATSASDTLSFGVSGATYAWIQSWAGRPLRINELGNNVNAYGTNGYGLVNTTASDVRIKKNIISIENALDKVNCLRGVYYEFDENNSMCMRVPSGKRRVGLIAQEVACILPEALLDSQDDSTPISLDYSGMIGLLTKAIQEQQCQICTQSTIIDQLKTCLGII